MHLKSTKIKVFPLLSLLVPSITLGFKLVTSPELYVFALVACIIGLSEIIHPKRKKVTA